jgi:hypothetical protein
VRAGELGRGFQGGADGVAKFALAHVEGVKGGVVAFGDLAGFV